MAEPPTNNREECEDFIRPIPWKTAPQRHGDIVFIAEDDGATLEIRINDFPDEPLYSLLKNGAIQFHFDDWPEFWGERPEFPG
jgi:hypothetical protein